MNISDLDKSFVPLSYQIKKDKRAFSDEEINSDDPNWYWKKINDPQFLNKHSYDVSDDDNEYYKLIAQVELLTKKLDHALNRISILEKVLDVPTIEFEDTKNITSNVDTVSDKINSDVELPTYLKFNYVNSVVKDMLGECASVVEQFILEKIMNDNGFGSPQYASKEIYIGIVPTADDIDKMYDRLEKRRLERLSKIEDPNVRTFTEFNDKCDAIISDEYKRKINKK